MITPEQVAELAAHLARARHDGHMPTDLEGMQRQIERIEVAKCALANTAPDMAALIAQQAKTIKRLESEVEGQRTTANYWLQEWKKEQAAGQEFASKSSETIKRLEADAARYRHI